MGKYVHKPALFTLVVLTAAFFVVTLTFNGLAAAGGGVFYNNTADISDKYYTEITPAGWTFSIWGFIYTWQVLFLCYGISTLFREGINGYLYYAPMIMPVWLYVIYNACSVFNIVWLILFDREYMIAALPILALMPFSLYWCIGFSCYAVDKYLPDLNKNDLTREAWLIRFIVQNGIAFYATWVTIATLLNLSVVLVYFANLSQETGCVICLAILTVDLVVWVTLDTFVLDRYVRYIFSPYIVVIIALAGIIDANYVDGATNSIFTVVLESLSCAAFILKLVLMFWRHYNKPLNTVMISPTLTTGQDTEMKKSQEMTI